MKTPQITNLKAILNEDKEVVVVTAHLDEKLHYTADIREMGYKSENYWAVFSDITLYDERMNGGVTLCIQEGIYKEFDITHTAVQVDHFIWVKIDLSNVEFSSIR